MAGFVKVKVWYRGLEFIFNHWIGFIEYCLCYDKLEKNFGKTEKNSKQARDTYITARLLYLCQKNYLELLKVVR